MPKSSFSTIFSLILLSLYSSSALAANDWSKACFNGTCSYDLPDDPSGPSGTLKIWGSNTSLADITTAGGWEIIGCDPNKREQDIRIVCKGIDMDGDGDNDGCSHLFAHGLGNSSGTNVTTGRPVPTGTVVDLGNNSTSTDEDQRAIGKIVRLPEECGKQSFARIANTWTHENQTIPSHISKRLAPLHRRTQNRHKVKGLTIDTQFHKSNSAQHGSVSFAIVGANVPGFKMSSTSTVPSLKTSGHSGKKRSFVHSRAFSQRRGIGDIISDAGDAISAGADAVGDAISNGVDAIGDALRGEISFNKSISRPFNFKGSATLIDQSIDCTHQLKSGVNSNSITPIASANGEMKVDVEAGIKGNMNIAVAAKGVLTDLRLDSFDLTTTLNADLNGAIVLSAGVGGSIDSGKIKFFDAGIPGFDFPEIFSIGPTLQINAEAKVSLNVDTDMRIGIVYHINDLEFDFPNGGKKHGKFNPGDTPLQLSAQPSAEATGKVEAHLIPTLSVGIKAFEGIAKAEVFVDMDASASMTLTVDATLPGVQANVTVREEKPAIEILRPGIRGRGPMGAYYFEKRSPVHESATPATPTPTGSSPTIYLNTSPSRTAETAPTSPSSVSQKSSSSSLLPSGQKATTSSTSVSLMASDLVVVNTQTQFGGCLEVDAGLAANLGADADFFGLFDPSKTIPLFQKQFSLLKKCFGDQKKRRSVPDLGSRHAVLAGRNLQCNAGNGGLEGLADEIVSEVNIL